jgi:hypothetical protein
MELAVKDKSGRVNLTTTWRELSIPQSSGNYLPLFPMITHISTRYLKKADAECSRSGRGRRSATEGQDVLNPRVDPRSA